MLTTLASKPIPKGEASKHDCKDSHQYTAFAVHLAPFSKIIVRKNTQLGKNLLWLGTYMAHKKMTENQLNGSYTD